MQIKLPKVRLSHGGHRGREGHCVMEYVDQFVFGNADKKDYPEQVDRNVARYLQYINDTSKDPNVLLEFVPQIATMAPLWHRSEFSSSILEQRLTSRVYPQLGGDLSVTQTRALAKMVVDIYDEVSGTKWQDRPMPEIPPLMEIFEQTAQAADVPSELPTGGWLKDAMATGPVISNYTPSVKVRIKTRWDQVKERITIEV